MLFKLNTFRVNISAEDISFLEANNMLPSLSIDQVRDVARIFVNGQLAGADLAFTLCQFEFFQIGLNFLYLLILNFIFHKYSKRCKFLL